MTATGTGTATAAAAAGPSAVWPLSADPSSGGSDAAAAAHSPPR